MLAAGTTELYQITADSPVIGKTMRQLDPRRRSGATVIAVVRGEVLHPVPPPEFRIEHGDCLVLAGSHADVEQAFRLLDGGDDRDRGVAELRGAAAPGESGLAPSRAAVRRAGRFSGAGGGCYHEDGAESEIAGRSYELRGQATLRDGGRCEGSGERGEPDHPRRVQGEGHRQAGVLDPGAVSRRQAARATQGRRPDHGVPPRLPVRGLPRPGAPRAAGDCRRHVQCGDRAGVFHRRPAHRGDATGGKYWVFAPGEGKIVGDLAGRVHPRDHGEHGRTGDRRAAYSRVVDPPANAPLLFDYLNVRTETVLCVLSVGRGRRLSRNGPPCPGLDL